MCVFVCEQSPKRRSPSPPSMLHVSNLTRNVKADHLKVIFNICMVEYSACINFERASEVRQPVLGILGALWSSFPSRTPDKPSKSHPVRRSNTQRVPRLLSLDRPASVLLFRSDQVPWHESHAIICFACLPRYPQEIFGSYGKVTSVDLAVDKRVNLPKVGVLATS